MLANGRVFGACVASALLLVTGCSSGGGKQSTPTSRKGAATAPSFSTSAGKACFVTSANHDFRPCPRPKFGKCPLVRPQFSELNPGVQGLSAKVVPIGAWSVRVCSYAGAAGTSVLNEVLDLDVAVRFEVLTNRLPALPLRRSGVSCEVGAPSALLTFASDSKQVDVVESCGQVTNGVFAASATAKWRNELKRALLQNYFSESSAEPH